eukprot:5244350-Prymnesium_polylepis.1
MGVLMGVFGSVRADRVKGADAGSCHGTVSYPSWPPCKLVRMCEFVVNPCENMRIHARDSDIREPVCESAKSPRIFMQNPRAAPLLMLLAQPQRLATGGRLAAGDA